MDKDSLLYSTSHGAISASAPKLAEKLYRAGATSEFYRVTGKPLGEFMKEHETARPIVERKRDV